MDCRVTLFLAMTLPWGRALSVLSSQALLLFVVRPHPQDENGFFRFHHFVDQAVLDIDPAGIKTLEVTL